MSIAKKIVTLFIVSPQSGGVEIPPFPISSGSIVQQIVTLPLDNMRQSLDSACQMGQFSKGFYLCKQYPGWQMSQTRHKNSREKQLLLPKPQNLHE
ncbi:MAG: hypothetical protein PVF23_06995 [Chromatiales bacterium]